MKTYLQPKWATHQWNRRGGLVEDICEHGIGHPNQEYLDAHPHDYWLGVHGCDGCCSLGRKDEPHSH